MEKDLLAECKNLDRVVQIIDAGDLLQLRGQKLQIPVPYILFEKADVTARSVVFAPLKPRHGWKLRTLHQVAVGLYQMHGRMIAHQDVKLSNILIFDKDKVAKISDLGRSVQQGRAVPHENQDWPGDWTYAPPEYVYGYTPAEFNARRFAADLYLLGSCAATVFTDVPLNALLYTELPANFRTQRHHGTYTGQFSDVLPHLKDAFSRVLATIVSNIPTHAPYRSEMATMIQQWCDPDPSERGHPRTRAIAKGSGNAYNLERYLSTLDLLAHKADLYDETLRHA